MASYIGRRKFLATLGGAAAAWPLAAQAQQQGARLPTIGFLGSSTLAEASPWVSAFVERLRELGWSEGRNIALAFRWAGGQPERYSEIATEFVQLKVDVIVTFGTPAALAAKQATAAVPIVLALAGDPVSAGLVASLARPGGNVTGLSSQSTDLTGKRLALLREVVPGLRRLAIMGNVASPTGIQQMGESRAAARALELEPVPVEIRAAKDIAPAFEPLKGHVDALYVIPDPIANTNRIRINTLALGARLPTMLGARDAAREAGLMSYGPNIADLFRRAADYVDKILRGAKPGEIPVEQPTKFDLIINLTTAKALGLTIPESFLLRADELIE
jgi:putative tryptophan/tyrosine transport system substrate-binding protein